MGKKQDVASDSIRVCVRFRPQNSVEKRNGGKIAIQVSPDGSVARILHPKQVKINFKKCLFEEAIFGHSCVSNLVVWTKKVRVQSFFPSVSKFIFRLGLKQLFLPTNTK